MSLIKNIKAGCFTSDLKKIHNIIYWIALIFIIITGIYLRTKLYLLNLSMRNDESALALNLLNNQTYFDMFKGLEYTQASPPFFMVISKFLLDISGQINNVLTRSMVLRFFPFLCSVATVPLFTYLVNKMFKNKFMTLTAAAILAVNKLAIHYTQEFKQYSLELLIAIILLLVFYNFNIKTLSDKKILLYSIVFSLAPWFSYSSFFILIPAFIYIIYEILNNKFYNKKKLAALFLPVLLSGILFFIHYSFVKHVNSNGMELFWAKYHGFITSKELFKYLAIRLKFITSAFGDVAALYTFLGAVFLLYKTHLKTQFIIIMPVLLCILASMNHKWPFVPRLLLFLLPMFAIMLANLSRFVVKRTVTLFLFAAIAITPAIFALIKPVDYYNINKSHSLELFKIMLKRNADFKNNVLSYTIIGKYYLQAYNNKYTNLNIQYEPYSFEYFIRNINEMPTGETLWIFMPYYANFRNCKNPGRCIKEYIQKNKRFTVLDITEKKDNEYLIEFRKNY